VAVRRVGVVGAGVMGSEIAQVAAAAGLEVVLLDVDPSAVERGLAHVRGIGERRVARGRMSAAEAEAIAARVTPATEDAALAGCDLAIEAVTEVIDVKRDVFRRLDAALGPEALLASNTSGLSITALGGETGRPDRVLGLHFFNPASVMRLVEVIQGEDTSEATAEAGAAFAEALGKSPVRVRECPGFLVNRVLVRALAEAYRRAGQIDADRAAADAAVVAGGPAPMGPFALGDLIGLDTLAHVRSDLDAGYGDRFADGGALAALVAAGRLGQKSGAGFHDGLAQEAEPDAAGRDVAERYYLGALDEACRCLEEGVAALADVDLAMRLGAGWAAGPLAWADAEGLDAVRDRLAVLADEAGPRFAPRPPLTDRAAAGTPFLAPV
jgi:3-hydroxyacyl-CoA dehydrogenase